MGGLACLRRRKSACVGRWPTISRVKFSDFLKNKSKRQKLRVANKIYKNKELHPINCVKKLP